MGGVNYKRQLDIVRMDTLDTPILIIGAGGIGSFVALYLAQMGMNNITIYDHDKIEDHNLPNQNFDLEQIGMNKVDAVKYNVLKRTGITINTFSEKFRSDTYTKQKYDIMILATDSITSREVCKEWALANEVKWIIDGRLSGQYYQVFAVCMTDPVQVEVYNEYFFDQSEAETVSCTAKAVIYVALSITTDIIHLVKRIIHDQPINVFQSNDMVSGIYVFDERVCCSGY